MAVTVPLLLILPFAVAAFGSLIAGIWAAFAIRRSLRHERNRFTSSQRPTPGDGVPRRVRVRRLAVVANFAAPALFFALASISFTAPFLESNLKEIANYGVHTTGIVVGARANAPPPNGPFSRRRQAAPYTISYRYQAGPGLYTGVAGVESKSTLDAYVREPTIPVVYSSVHPGVSRPGSRASAAAELRRERQIGGSLSAVLLVMACGFAAFFWRRMIRVLRLARTGALRSGTILEVKHYARGRIRALVSVDDALGPRLHTWHTSRYITMVPPVENARVDVLADTHDPTLIEVCEAVQRWAVVEAA
jgi:hypothetical protein